MVLDIISSTNNFSINYPGDVLHYDILEGFIHVPHLSSACISSGVVPIPIQILEMPSILSKMLDRVLASTQSDTTLLINEL